MRKIKSFTIVLISCLLLSFLYVQHAYAGIKSKAVTALIVSAGIKMVGPGVSNVVKQKSAAYFWKTLAKHEKSIPEVVDRLKAEAQKNPKIKHVVNNLIARIHKRFPELNSRHTLAKVEKINNRNPINQAYAGKIYPSSKLSPEARKLYPDGIPFTKKGFPDFSRYSIKKAKIKPQSNRDKDMALADKVSGYDGKNPRPKEYTWHHTENPGELILIPRLLHQNVRHTGGIAVGK